MTLAQLFAGFEGERPFPERPIVITFDDGYESFLSIGAPVLEQFEYKATVFLVSSCVGSTNRWDEQVGDVKEVLMSKEQVLECVKKGHEFGSHTRNHANLCQVDLSNAEEEIRESKASLESWLPTSVQFFCYPYGSENSAVQKLVKDAGYKAATSVRKGTNGPHTNPYSLGRLNVRSTTSSFQLALKLFRAKPLI